MTTTQTIPTQTGIVVSTAITAGGWSLNHAEGIVVSTAITGGGKNFNHAEGIVVSTAATPAGIAVSTQIVAGPKRIFIGGLS